MLLASRLITVQRPGSSKESLPLHPDVVEAIAARDSHGAAHAMVELIAMTQRHIETVLHRRGDRTHKA